MGLEPPAGGRLTDDEVRQMSRLLARYAAHDLDQFDHWRIEAENGPVFIVMTNELPPEWPPGVFQTIWPLPHKLQQ